MTQLRTINTNLSFRAKSRWERLRATGSDRGRPGATALEVIGGAYITQGIRTINQATSLS
eukprot:3049338-Pleurochrysis_carterae.AAC.1